MPKTLKPDTKTKDRKFFTHLKEVVNMPALSEVQLNSWNWFVNEGIREVLDEISPISAKNYELTFGDYEVEAPKITVEEAIKKNLAYEASVRGTAKLLNKETGEVREQEVFLGDIPVMTQNGTFVINGIERVIVSQLVRSSGAFFVSEFIAGRNIFGAKIIPTRGAWFEFETNAKDVINVKIDRGRKIPFTTFLRAMGLATNEEIIKTFADVNTDPEHNYIQATLEKDTASSYESGLIEVYKKIRPGDLATVENAKQLIQTKLFNFRYYDLGRVGRYKLNKRLELNVPNNKDTRTLTLEDFIAIVKELIKLNNGFGEADDIDNLANRRVRSVGELVQNKFRIGFLRMERIVRDRMSIADPETATPAQLINIKPVVASLQEFYASSQLSQFMDQNNALSEITHKRRLSAMGPGGLSRERAGFDVRDVHVSHYGRICPLETPEGPNIGLVSALACYARVNEYGFIETPYRKVLREIENNPKKTLGRTVWEEIKDSKGKLIAKRGDLIDKKLAELLAKTNNKTIPIKSIISDEIVYLDAYDEAKAVIAPANTKLTEENEFAEERVPVRKYSTPSFESVGYIDYMDVSPKQILSVSSALIPFFEHDNANRTHMGAGMQKQAVPLVFPDSPVVGTGIEKSVGVNSGKVILAEENGKITKASNGEIQLLSDKGKVYDYKLDAFVRSNQSTCLHQRIRVSVGEKVSKGDCLADSTSTDNAELALGQNLLVAFMPADGGNFEDAIVISERLVREDLFSSIHIEKFSIEVRDTKLGSEVITRDIPNVGEEALKYLDDEGIIQVGAEVKANDILVGKITPKGESELSAEERLLRAIFGEKARDVKDTSLKLPHGERGKVVAVHVREKEKGDKLPIGVLKQIEVEIAQLRKITVGDKLAGRHGNKGVIAKVLPEADMPHLEDGTPVDILLNPLGVTSRMNIGQIFETHLGWAVSKLGYKVATPALDGIKINKLTELLKEAGLPEDGKAQLFDGKTGEAFDEKTTVGVIYMLKLNHMVEDKMHARSTGPYSLVTQQPLGGKAQFGGQRFGEMEVWALEGYGASHTLQEMLTVKSDDVVGRPKTYESIIKGEPAQEAKTPESFNVLIKELQSLGLSVELLKEKMVEEKKQTTKQESNS